MSASLEQLNAMDQSAFVALLGGVYEHSPWVAERAWGARPFGSREALHDAMERAVGGASRAQQLALIRAHPELDGRFAVAAKLTAASRSEQVSAGLHRCTPAEFARLQALNFAYREKFDFPFIVAVRGLTRAQIMARVEERLANSPEQEFTACLREIGRIARFRLRDLIEE